MFIVNQTNRQTERYTDRQTDRQGQRVLEVTEARGWLRVFVKESFTAQEGEEELAAA